MRKFLIKFGDFDALDGPIPYIFGKPQYKTAMGIKFLANQSFQGIKAGIYSGLMSFSVFL